MKRLLVAILIACASLASAQVADPVIKVSGGAGGLPAPIADELTGKTIYYAAANIAAEYVYGWSGSLDSMGAASVPTPTATAYGQYWARRMTTAGTANSWGGWELRDAAMTAGLGARVTGFKFEAVIRTDAYLSGHSAFCGLVPGTSALLSGSSIAAPTSLLNTVGIMFDAGGTANWQICSNDNVGSATCVDSGVARGTLMVIDVVFEAQPNSSTIEYVLFRRDTNTTIASGSLSSEIMIDTAPFKAACFVSRQAVAATFMDMINVSLIFPY